MFYIETSCVISDAIFYIGPIDVNISRPYYGNVEYNYYSVLLLGKYLLSTITSGVAGIVVMPCLVLE